MYFLIVIYLLIPVKSSPNDFERGNIATKHLIQSGKTNLIHLLGPTGLILSEQRTRGFIQGHQDLDIPFDNEIILRCGDEDDHENFKIIQSVLERGMKFDGIFAVYDITVVGTLEESQTAQNLYHKKSPLSVILIGNFHLLSHLN